MGLIKNYFKNRTAMFYVALSVAVLSIIAAIFYTATLNHLTEDMSWTPFILLLTGAAVFAVLSVFRLSRLGTAVMAILDFAAFLTFAGTIYNWPVSQAMVISNIADIKELPAMIVSAVMMLICIVLGNVCAWKRLQRKAETNGGK